MGALRLQFLYNHAILDMPSRVSREIAAYLQRLIQIKAAKQAEVELIDVREMSGKEISELYDDAIQPLSRRNKIRVSYPIHQRAAFGIEEPILLVWQGKELKMVYPHRKRSMRPSRVSGKTTTAEITEHTIEHFLRSLKPCVCWKLMQ